MKSIWKFDCAVTDEISIRMPRAALILCVQMQLGKPRIWAKVDHDDEMVDRNFRWYGTGHDVDVDGVYIGTVQDNNSGFMLVFHLFEVTK